MREYYIAFHKVDPKSEFFKKIFQEVRNVFNGKRCERCQEFLPTSKFKINHDFLKNHENGKNGNAVEEKPVNITNISTIRKFEITFQEHSSIYDFYNSEALADEIFIECKKQD